MLPLNKEGSFVHVSDLSAANAMSTSAMRRRASNFMTAESERSARLCRGAVQIVPSPLMRGTMTALHWVSPPPYPSALASTVEEGMKWAENRCDAAGLAFQKSPTDAA